jgi:hypothetical protein
MNERKTGETMSRPAGNAFDGVQTISGTGTTVASYDHDADPLSVAVPELVAYVEDVPPTSLPPLYSHIDPDALDQLFAHRSASTVGISFQYAGYTVSVSDGTLSVTPAQ